MAQAYRWSVARAWGFSVILQCSNVVLFPVCTVCVIIYMTNVEINCFVCNLQSKEDVKTVENDTDNADAPSEKKQKLDVEEVYLFDYMA